MDVKNVPVQPVRPRDLIYSYSVTGAVLLKSYERGKDVFVYDGDVLSLDDEARPAPGHYRTCNRHGLVQMGSSPVGPLSADPDALTRSFLTLRKSQEETTAAINDLRREVMQQSRLLAASA